LDYVKYLKNQKAKQLERAVTEEVGSEMDEQEEEAKKGMRAG
jgi:hypothetical protein